MSETTKADLQIASSFAHGCLRQCDEIFREANRNYENRTINGIPIEVNPPPLKTKIKNFCDFLDASRSSGRNKIPKVNRHFIRTRSDSEPLTHGNLIETTAHSLVWHFTHRLWLAVHSVAYARLVLSQGGDLPDDDSFQIDDESLNESLDEIRESILEIEPIDSQRFRRILEIEHEKALYSIQRSSDKTDDTGRNPDGQKGQLKDSENKRKNARKLTPAARQCFKEFKADRVNDLKLTLKDHVNSWATEHVENFDTIYKACTSNHQELDKLFP